MAGKWRNATVSELQAKGVLFVEDGNHGEYRPLPDEFVEDGNGTPFVRPDDLQNGRVDFGGCDCINDQAFARVRKGKGKPGDIVFTHRATVGRIARVGRCAPSFVANPGVTIWRSTDPAALDPVYLYFFMQTRTFMDQVWAEAGNTDTFPYISLTQQRRLLLTFPSITQQRAIAHILGTLDDKIELNRRISETLEAMACALFKSWFVDFDPVRAKAEGREPDLPDAIADLFPDALTEHPDLGEIPRGWEAGRLGDAVELLRAQESPQSSPDVVFRHFSIPAFDEGQWPKSELGGSIKSQKSRVPPGAVLLSKLNPEIERVWLVDVAEGDRAVCSTEFLVLLPKSPVGRSFVYCIGRSRTLRCAIEGLVTGTSKSHQRARAETVLSVRTILPPPRLAEAFEKLAAPLLCRTLATRRESRTLAALRDALLPKLISGELRLDDAKRILERAG